VRSTISRSRLYFVILRYFVTYDFFLSASVITNILREEVRRGGEEVR